jgi:hypothetical protein
MAQAIRSFSQAPYVALGTSFSINKPAGTVDGDLLFIAIAVQDTTVVNTLAGWTPSYSGGGANGSIQTFYKVASGEPASYTWTSASTRACAVMVCISGASGIIDASSSKSNTNINNLLGTDITTTAPNEVLIWVAERPNVASGGQIQVPTNTVLQGSLQNAGGTTITTQMALSAAIFPSQGITNSTWSAGQLGGGTTANSTVILHTFKDAGAGGVPLMFCEA